MSILSKKILIFHTAYLRNGGTAVSGRRFLLDCAENLVLVMWGRHCDTFHTSLCTRYLVSGYAYFMTKSVQGILGLSHM